MKDLATCVSLKESVEKALADGCLLDALCAMEGLAANLESSDLMDQVGTLKQAYSLLLDYYAKGVDDPERYRLHRQFVNQTYELLDVAGREMILGEGAAHYAAVWRLLQKACQVSRFADVEHIACDYRRLFEMAWTAPLWNASDYEAAHARLKTVDEFDANVLVSGVMMGGLQVFDFLRLKWLLDIAAQRDRSLQVRALVGVILVCRKWGHRVSCYPALEKQMELLTELAGVKTLLQAIQMQFVLTAETEQIEKSLREEILPEMMKKARESKGRLGTDLQDGFAGLDINPEWEADGQPSVLGKKMRELSEMQRKGADVFMGSFKMLKQQYPFFNVAVNWFCPFSWNHPDLNFSGQSLNPLLTKILGEGNLCDSDRYSFALFLRDLPKSHHEMMRQQFDAAIGEHGAEILGKSPDSDGEKMILVRSYIQNLYRFFHLFRYRRTKDNPFDSIVSLLDIPAWGVLLSDEAVVRRLADFAFGEKCYSVAQSYYEWLPDSAEVLQKIGFCHQAGKRYDEAVAAYEKAHLLESGSAWTLRQMGTCYRNLGDFKRALECYEELEKVDSENVRLLLQLSECYLALKKYDKVFEKLYKADYLSPQGGIALQALAWCSLVTGKLEQAMKYYKKILDKSPTTSDYYNAGHAAWLSGDVVSALEYYHASLKSGGLDFAPKDFFEEDAEVLRAQGKCDADFSMMVDALNR